MNSLRKIYLQILTCLLVFCIACNSISPKKEPPKSDTLTTATEQKTEYEDPPLPFTKTAAYDGTVKTARKQIAEIKEAVKTKSLSIYSYLYDNDSGGDPLAGLMYFSLDDDRVGKGREWCLELYSNYYSVNYYFDNDFNLFAIIQWETGPKAKVVAEIFYKKDGSIMSGSWLKRASEDVADLATYKGDYWYDFWEGFPFYPTVDDMKNDKKLMYQQ